MSAFRQRPRAAAALIVSAVAALLLAGCATAPVGSVTPSPSASGGVELSNCGVAVDVPTAPKRVITIKSTSTEMLLALGLGDRIVGEAFQDGPVPDEWAADAADIDVISDMMPSPEAVLEREPDFVYSGWESAFAPDAAGDRAELAGLGIGSYVSPAACRSADVPASIDFDEVFREITEVAGIFQVDATPLIEKQKAELAKLQPDSRGLTALWYSSGTDTPYVGAGTGAPELVLDTIGLANIAGDIQQAWSPLGWEAIVDADPDVIVLIDATWNTADSKIALLESNPATAQLTAVKNGNYLILPFAASEAGVRTADAAVTLAAQLADIDSP